MELKATSKLECRYTIQKVFSDTPQNSAFALPKLTLPSGGDSVCHNHRSQMDRTLEQGCCEQLLYNM